MNAPFNGGGGGFHPNNNAESGYAPTDHSTPHHFRKRGWRNYGIGSSPDFMDDLGPIKLYVSPVPRTATEADIRPIFEGHGTVVEVVLLKDKRTGLQQGSCFVKYANRDGAGRAINNLSNLYIFPGEASPIIVKFAAGERERLGSRGILDKVFVTGLNKEASKKEIEEIFSPYGLVEDIFIVRDEQKQSRGYGFVQFSDVEMALAAIKGLNGAYTMRGCNHPLTVRFADPKKPKTGEPRLAPNLGDSMGRSMAQYHSTVSHTQAASHMGSLDPNTGFLQQTLPPQCSAPQQPPMPLQPSQSQQFYSHMAPSESHRQSHLKESCPNIESQCSLQTGTNPPTFSCSITAGAPGSLEKEAPLDCNWSEHTCPDGYKYYYNCITCESRWEKPEDYNLYEHQLHKQRQVESINELHSPLQNVSSQYVTQKQTVHSHENLIHQKLQQPLYSQELDRVHVQPETGPVVDAACV